tara:strand:- start:1 stop:558 length:558 start_codon:yes stop_codon:yes gene_type:complete
MSTNSLVAFLKEDGSVVSSYVHYDGYVTGVGKTLLEHYNTEEYAFAVSTAGYFSSLSDNLKKSLKGSIHKEEYEVFENMEVFEGHIRENGHLEFVYIWKPEKNKWMVASWTNTRKEVYTEQGRDFEFKSTWNGFEDLITAYIREGNITLERMLKHIKEGATEYIDYVQELAKSLEMWNRISVSTS